MIEFKNPDAGIHPGFGLRFTWVCFSIRFGTTRIISDGQISWKEKKGLTKGANSATLDTSNE